MILPLLFGYVTRAHLFVVLRYTDDSGICLGLGRVCGKHSKSGMHDGFRAMHPAGEKRERCKASV